MAQHSVQVVDDGTLAAREGWAFARCEATGDLYFVVERSAAADAKRLSEAWKAAAQLEIEQAVREGIVQYAEPPAN